MKNYSISINDSEIMQTEKGLFVNNQSFIPIVIKSITPYYHFTTYSSYSKGYEIKLIETDSYFPDKPLTLYYNPDSPRQFLGSLRAYGLKSDFLLKDSIEIWNLIIQNKETGLLAEKPLLSSEQSGWILFEDNLYYMTSQFAISKNGIIPEYHCLSPNANLLYDQTMDPADAFAETMELISLDFNETMPILVSQILSFLQPVVEREKLYSIPGLFLSGPTSTGKTELALALGTLFGNPVTKDIQNFLILQSRPKDFEQHRKQFSDTTFILDDARKSPAQSVRESIAALIDRFGRSAFAKNGTRLIPIVTGEPQILSGHLASLRNRFVEVYLNPSDEKMASRKDIIRTCKDNPQPLRTCLLGFIKFIGKNYCSEQLTKEIGRIRKEFSTLFDEPVDRTDDNLFMYYLGFRLFMHYGKTLNCFTVEEQKGYIENYKKTLEDISQNSASYSEEGRIHTFILFLCNSINEGRLKIYTPEVQTCYYEGDYYTRDGYGVITDTYGHFSIIDISHGFDGVYIKNRMALPNCSQQSGSLPVLVINRDKFLEALNCEGNIFKQSHGYNPLPLKEGALKKLLADKGLLYTEDRHEKNYRNYSCLYPHWGYDQNISCEPSICINMDSPYAKALITSIVSSANAPLPPDCLYESNRLYMLYSNLTGFDNIRSFKHFKI